MNQDDYDGMCEATQSVDREERVTCNERRESLQAIPFTLKLFASIALCFLVALLIKDLIGYYPEIAVAFGRAKTISHEYAQMRVIGDSLFASFSGGVLFTFWNEGL